MKMLLARIRRILRNNRIRRDLYRVISVLAAVTVFVTTYALVLPAITMEKTASCGIEEHQHNDSCFSREIICGQEESEGHKHTDDCYLETQELVCETEEHTHSVDNGCYDEDGNLICQKTEHVHAEDCYETVRELTCGLEESEGHQHTDDCYTLVLTCGKEAHTHSTACFEAEEEEADEEEADEDEASSDVSEPATSSEPEVAPAKDLDPVTLEEYLTGDTSAWYRKPGAGDEGEAGEYDWERITDKTELEADDIVRFFFAYSIPAGMLNETNPQTVFKLPRSIHLTDTQIKELNAFNDGRGAWAVEGLRTPDTEPGSEEYVSAWFKLENVQEKDAKDAGDGQVHRSIQEVVLTFDDTTIEKNQNIYDTNGDLVQKGQAITGHFLIDVNTDQIDFEAISDETFTETIETEDGSVDRTIEETHSEAEVVLLQAQPNAAPGTPAGDGITTVIRLGTEGVLAEETHVDGDDPEPEPGDGDVEDAHSVGDGNDVDGDGKKNDSAVTAGTLTFEGPDYTVTASYTEEAGIPEGASLVVSEIREDEDAESFENYRGQAEAAVAQENGRDTGKKISWIRLFDITIEKNDVAIEPQAPVSVQITYHEAIEQTAETAVDTVHFEGTEETPRVLDTEAEGAENTTEQVTFETDGFSVFAIVGTVIEKYVLASDGRNYRITATYGPEAGVPEGAELEVNEVTSESSVYGMSYDEYVAYTENALAENEKVTFARFFDIKIVKDGEEIQPEVPVDVKIELADELNEDVKAVHFEHSDDGRKAETETPILLDASQVEAEELADAVSFEAESFSVYGVIMTIETTVITAEGRAYKISVTYGPEAGVPEGAWLEASEIVPSEYAGAENAGEIVDETVDETSDEAAEYETYLEKTKEALGIKSGVFEYARFFDIKIVDENGEKIQITAPVDVKIELADKESGEEDNTQVVHFADGSESGDVVEITTEAAEEGQVVSFEAEGFSVYGIVDLDSAETAGAVNELDGNSYYLSVDEGSNRYYYTDSLALVSSAWKFQRTTTLDSAARFYFEAVEADEQGNSFLIYILDENGTKHYVNLEIETTSLRYFSLGEEAETATRYTVDIHTEGTPNTFRIYHKAGAREFYYWNRNGAYFELAKNNSVPRNNNDKILLTQIGSDDTTPSDPYELDGQSLGVLWNNNNVSGSGMMASSGTANITVTLTDEDGNILKDENNKNRTEKETINILKNKTATVRIDPVGREDRVFVAQDSEITMWTFTCCGPAQYYITAVVNGELKYVRFDDTVNYGNSDKGISLVDSPDERCKITVTEGTGTYSGKYKFSCSGRTLYNNNGNFYTVADTQNGANVWMYFAELSNLNDDDFVVYTAKKVSISGTLDELGNIDYDVKDGDQVVLYTRIWNENTLEYEYYAIDYDGMLVKAYMSGDNISWVGSKVNTMLWDFTEYHYLDDDGNETDVPNYYYELQNNYSGKYIAPQVSGTDFLSDSPIGINLNGRRYNEYYSTILAWDDPYYDYATLMAQDYQLVSAPMSMAQDFYFAIMTDEEESGELSTVETIDHTNFGITVKMINYPGGAQSTANGNFHNMIQTYVLGQTNKNGSTVYADLLKKNLSDNGYPDVALSGYTDHNLSELYSNCADASETTVNHTFLASTYSETGYFEYDCTQNFAHLITSTDDIWYGKPMPGGGTYGIGDFVVYDQLGTTSETGDTRRHGQFFPYNDLAESVEVDEDGNLVINPKYNYSTTMYNTTNIKGQSITSLDPRYGEQLYQIPNNSLNKLAPNVDHYFGMEMDASFMQSENGLDAWGHDLIFEFSGDDDFWLYIDGKLVLDLGGIHSACDGSINFRTGTVIVNGRTTNLRTLYKEAYLEEHPEATDDEISEYLNGFFKDGGTVFKDFSGHEMKMFYMERGAGASNLHMRFNLAPYVNGEVQLEKEVSGTDTVSTQFPFQIGYWENASARYVQVGSEGHDLSVRDTNTGDPISHQENYSIDGVSYDHVYFLNPGQTASVQLPSEDTQYYFVECGIDPNTYDQVTANKVILEGTAVAGSDSLKDYRIIEDTVSGRKKVIYNNHVSDTAQKTLTVTKRLWREFDKETEIFSGEGADADNTIFKFRIYIGDGSDITVDGTGYAVYNTGKYYVKGPDGCYCIWQDGGFVSTGKDEFSRLSTVKAEGEWKSEAEKATFYSSPGGAIDNIKAGYSVEIPGLMAGTKYYIEERLDEIPAGYNLIDYTTTEGAYSSANPGTAANTGTIASNDSNRTISVHNQHGYGLTVNKVWSDAAFMSSHDDIYFGVYLEGTLVADSVRCLKHPATSINWFFPELADGRTLNDYQVYELELTVPENGNITVNPATGEVTGFSAVTKKEQDSSIEVEGVSNEHGYSVSYSYTVSYERETLTDAQIADKVNSRTDTVANSRPGIRFTKTDLKGSALEGAVFKLTDGGNITKTFTSAEDGLIAVAYLESDKEYTLTETAAPYGYLTLISSIIIEKKVEGGKTVVYVNGSPTGDSTGYYTITQVDEPTADNMPTVSIKNKDYTLRAVKVDLSTGLPMEGVKFALYKEVKEAGTGNPMPDYNPISGYESLVTDEEGIIPKIAMKNSENPNGLTEGIYYLREVETPSGYNSLGVDIRITISATGEITLQSAIRPSQSGSWSFAGMNDSIASVAYDENTGIMQITVKNTPKDPVRIKKLEEGTKTTLAGVSFSLYKISQIGDDGFPREEETALISGNTDDDGLLLLGGLEENTSYYLYETATLPGYIMLSAPVIITTIGPNTINASLNGTPLNCEQVTDENGNNVWEITVFNSTGYELPATGGPGTNLIYLIGSMMLAFAGAGLVMRRRRRA